MLRSARAPRLKPRGCDEHPLDYKDLDYLKKFLTPQGQLQGRRRTGFCAQCQRDLKKAIKRARHLALLPFVS
jgi:small subunit ribosomal protein S18